MNQSKLRRQILAAGRSEVRRRLALLENIKKLDLSILVAAVRTFESAGAAGEWLIQPARGLDERTPAKFGLANKGKERVILLLRRIEHNVLS